MIDDQRSSQILFCGAARIWKRDGGFLTCPQGNRGYCIRCLRSPYGRVLRTAVAACCCCRAALLAGTAMQILLIKLSKNNAIQGNKDGNSNHLA